MKNIVITIGREYGSGGRYIGWRVAKKLNIPFYDKEILNKTYEKNGCNYSKLNSYDEVKKNKFLKALEMMNINNYDATSDNNNLYDMYQNLISKTITELAESGPCVILGRNSNNILKNKKNVINIFIYSNDLEFKLKRKMLLEGIDRNEALKRLKTVDKQRKQYYQSINKNKVWGNRYEYDFIIDSSVLDIDGTVDLIVYIYKKYQNKQQ